MLGYNDFLLTIDTEYILIYTINVILNVSKKESNYKVFNNKNKISN